MHVKFFNTISKTLEDFVPISDTVGMYVCGPTVYDRPHIGNARSVVVYDVLYRILIENFGKDSVKYVRNITDVDDKINKAAKEKKISIQTLTMEMLKHFHHDIAQLNCLSPNIEPKATEHISEIIDMISKLIETNHAYISEKHVYFDVASFPEYGKLSRKNVEELEAGHRIDVSQNKKSAEDFVLWKPASKNDDESSVFDSPWGQGRPGWHIECSAMSTKYLDEDFDIHGGGVDLIFPHHTNEIAQSCACYEGSQYARYWIHNGFVTVNGEKMSKSLGNFFTVKDLIDQGINGETIRYVYLSTHYRKPLNWNDKSVEDAKKSLDSFYRILSAHKKLTPNDEIDPQVLDAMNNDMNIPAALSVLHEIAREYNKTVNSVTKAKLAGSLLRSGQALGILNSNPEEWFHTAKDKSIDALVEKRKQAKLTKDWSEADKIRITLQEKGIILEDHPDGTTTWRKK